MEQEQATLTNRIVIASGGGDYTTLPPGNHLMGLVQVKDIEKSVYLKPDEKQPGYRFTFRSAAEPSGYVNVDVATKWGDDRTGLYKLLAAMTNYEIQLTSTATVVFNTITSLLGTWYKIPVENNPSKKDPTKVYANLRKGTFPVPCAGPDSRDANEFFQAIDGVPEVDAGNDFEAMPDVVPDRARELQQELISTPKHVPPSNVVQRTWRN
jgi:hypothetical protein